MFMLVQWRCTCLFYSAFSTMSTAKALFLCNAHSVLSQRRLLAKHLHGVTVNQECSYNASCVLGHALYILAVW